MNRMAEILRVGIIADTHGVLHSGVPSLFASVDR